MIVPLKLTSSHSLQSPPWSSVRNYTTEKDAEGGKKREKLLLCDGNRVATQEGAKIRKSPGTIADIEAEIR